MMMNRKNRGLRTDEGFTTVELLVSMGLFALLAGMGLSAYFIFVHGAGDAQDRVKVWAGMQDANGQLMRDIQDATAMPVAESQTIALNVVRDDKCQTRTYKIADPKLTVTTDFFEGASCSGASESRDVTLVGKFVSTATFAYYGETDKLIPPPVKDSRTIRRVQWKLDADLGGKTTKLVSMESGSAFSGRGDTAGTGDPLVSAASPFLTVVTNATGKEGVDAPALSWADVTASLSTGFTVYRTANPAGMAHTDKDYKGSQQLWSTPDATTTTWTDTTLPAGYTAQYYVRAWIPNVGSGMGPESNKVVTGLRPAQVKGLSVTGKLTTLDLAWDAAVGATSYDVFRDGAGVPALVNVPATAAAAVRTFTDDFQVTAPVDGYGNSHKYTVVGVNQWETLAKASGTPRFQSASDEAFTAPAAPSLAVAPTNAWSNELRPALAGWVGTGPVGARDRGWEVQSHLAAAGFTNLWTGAGEVPGATAMKVDGGRVAGTFTFYQVRTCNLIGCSLWATGFQGLQRPATPTCTPSGITTRSMVVSVNPAAMPETAYTNFEVTGGTGTPTGVGQQGTTSFAIDQLTHGTADTWAARSQNATGWSDPAACGATTVTLATPAISVAGITTRGANAAATCGNGSGCTVGIDGGAASRNDLKDNTSYGVHAENSDGWNVVGADSSFKTLLLSTPSAPTCTATVTDAVATGSITIGGGDQVKISSGGTVSSGPRAYSLGEGTYTGYARNITTDNLNTNYSGWDACPSRTITEPAPAAPTGLKLVCSGGSSASGSWDAVPGATSYSVETQWRDAGFWYSGTGSTTTGTTASVSSSTGSCMNGVKFRVTATNASGTSLWSAYKQVP